MLKNIHTSPHKVITIIMLSLFAALMMTACTHNVRYSDDLGEMRINSDDNVKPQKFREIAEPGDGYYTIVGRYLNSRDVPEVKKLFPSLKSIGDYPLTLMKKASITPENERSYWGDRGARSIKSLAIQS
uniref:Uncharacterized protein n=1 Tax=Candidatus Kentrum sp. LPFa TaxID=2126335 RepID=A0A450W9E6_9GAMM|nr:MAG: hypothetical protein BECKLPF1236A_GA0070988_100929 [Candidatus Kentron sp. LPFa]VFK34821.1 MAG: hypothetical protein BECKLPF1236C_GA0070990_103033 [Candidatus Kentron sp. LPFa]